MRPTRQAYPTCAFVHPLSRACREENTPHWAAVLQGNGRTRKTLPRRTRPIRVVHSRTSTFLRARIASGRARSGVKVGEGRRYCRRVIESRLVERMRGFGTTIFAEMS